MKILITVKEFADMGFFNRLKFINYCKEVNIELVVTTEQKVLDHYKGRM